MSGAISVHDVAIATSTVEIQTIVVGNKQMTQAVYRQLPIADVFETGGISGCWGRIHHCRPECRSWSLRTGHLHVVWVNDGVLSLDIIEPPTVTRSFERAWFDGCGRLETDEELAERMTRTREYEAEAAAFWHAAGRLPQLYIAV